MEGGALAAVCRSIDLPLNHPAVEEAERALEEERARYEGAKADGETTAYQLRHKFGGQVAWAEDYLRAAQEGGGRTQSFEVQAVRIGDLALVAYPGEMFVDYQLTMDRESPFARTFTLEAVLKPAPSARERARKLWARLRCRHILWVDMTMQPNAAHGFRPPRLLLRALTAPALLEARMGF